MNWVSSAPEDVLLQRAKTVSYYLIMDKFEKRFYYRNRDSALFNYFNLDEVEL